MIVGTVAGLFAVLEFHTTPAKLAIPASGAARCRRQAARAPGHGGRGPSQRKRRARRPARVRAGQRRRRAPLGPGVNYSFGVFRSRSRYPAARSPRSASRSCSDEATPAHRSSISSPCRSWSSRRCGAKRQHPGSVRGELHQRGVHPVTSVSPAIPGHVMTPRRSTSLSASWARSSRSTSTRAPRRMHARRAGHAEAEQRTRADDARAATRLGDAPGPGKGRARAGRRGLQHLAPDSPVSRLRRGEITAAAAPPEVAEVISACRAARQLSGGWFDPWAMPGGFDPTGYVKGWAAQRALAALDGLAMSGAMVNAAGDIASMGVQPSGEAFRIGIADPGDPQRLAEIIELTGCIATSGTYERGSHLIDPWSGQPAARVASASVTGPDLGLADALATASRSPAMLVSISSGPSQAMKHRHRHRRPQAVDQPVPVRPADRPGPGASV